MKNIKLISLAALTLLAFACTKEQEVTKDAVTLKSTDLTVGKKGVAGAAASAAAIEFTANNNWTATPSVDWITLDKTSGAAGDVKLAVTVAQNDTYEERTGEVKIVCGEAQAKVNITQTLKEQFGVAVNRTLGYEAQTITLAVGTNMEYDINIDCGEGVEPWISLADTKAQPQIESVSLIIEANMGNTVRMADVKIGNDDAMVQYIFTQEGRSNTVLLGAAYLSNRQKPYDTETWAVTTFAQYSFGLNKVDGSNATLGLVINVAKDGADKAVLPTGYFECDAAGTHAPKTFSIKPADESEIAYTTIMIGEDTEVLVMDGTVEITKDENGEYTIKCTVMDENGSTSSFKYVGPMVAIEDQSFGGQVFSTYKADYNTHFATANNEFYFENYLSEPVEGVDEFVYSLSFTTYSAPGALEMNQLPEGTYTFTEETKAETGYKEGNTDCAAGTFSADAKYAGYSNPGDYYRNIGIKGGTITISNVNVEAGLCDISYDLMLRSYGYDHDTYELLDSTDFTYQATLTEMKYIASDNGLRPVLDEDQDFTGATLMNNKYIAWYYGENRFGLTGNKVFYWGLDNINYVFSVQIPISTTGDYTWEVNFGTKYCSNPLPAGTYNWSSAPAGDCICNIGNPEARKAKVKNTYTGKTAYVTGGSITISDTELSFNLTALIDETIEVHYTGGFDASLMYSRQDPVTKPAQYPLEWAPHYTFNVGNKGGAMQICIDGWKYYKFPGHEFTKSGEFKNYVEIVQDGTSYYINDITKVPEPSRIYQLSVVTAGTTSGEDYTIPSSGESAGAWFSWITSQGSLINNGTVIAADTEYTLTNDPSWGGNSYNISTNLTSGTKYASIVYDRTGDAKWKLIEVTTTK